MIPWDVFWRTYTWDNVRWKKGPFSHFINSLQRYCSWNKETATTECSLIKVRNYQRIIIYCALMAVTITGTQL